VSRDVA